MQKVKTTLAIAAIPDTWYAEISFNRRGTAAFIMFNAPGLLRQARQYIQQAQIVGTNGKHVWLDARRTREENRPARAVHRTYEGITELCAAIRQAGKTPPIKVEDLKKNLRKYSIDTAEGDSIGWYNVRTSTFQWTRSTIENFAKIERDEDLEQVAAWASIE